MVSISMFLSRLSTLVDSYRKINIVKNLADELGKYIRPEYIKEYGEQRNPRAINLGVILKGLNINSELDREEVLEDLVDEFKKKKHAERVLVEMEALARKKFGKDSVDLVGIGTPPRGLTPDEQKKVEEMVKDLGPYGAIYIKERLSLDYRDYIKKHTTTEYLDEKHEDIEKEDEESPGTHRNDIKFLHSEILNFLKKKHPGNDENDYLWEKIFEEAFDIDGRNDKSFKQLAEHFKLPESSFFKYYFVPMMKAVKEFLKSQGYHGDKKEVEKEIEEDLNDELKKTPPKEKLPDYQTYLKEPQNSKEFKEYLHKNRSTRMSPRTVKIVELFGEGLTNKEIVDKLPEVKLEETHRTKSEAFNKFYKNWYEEKMEKQLEDKEKVAGFFMPYSASGFRKEGARQYL